jgi:starvation-inducible DNA-binding protein
MKKTDRKPRGDQRDVQVELLNSCLANTLDLQSQAKHAHWNVKGQSFLMLHQLFDTLTDHFRAQADKIAERAATIGGFVEGTLRLAADGTAIAELPAKAIDGLELVNALAARFRSHAASLRAAVERVGGEEIADPVTENLLIEVCTQVEMDAWFLESHLRPSPTARTGVQDEEEARPEEEIPGRYPTP